MNSSQISALIVENTFLSIPEVAKEMPIVRHLTWVIHQRWDSAQRVAQIPRSLPIFMISGSKDEVVPANHMAELWDIAQRRGLSEDHETQQKGAMDVLNDELVVFPEGSHGKQSEYPSSIRLRD
jgi:pimeloyl-ACP methyl ester carboxylesterase